MAEVKVTEQIVNTVFKRYTLELSEDELKALYDIFMYVGGNPVTSRRRFVDNVSTAIREADPDTFVFGRVTRHDFRGDIMFKK